MLTRRILGFGKVIEIKNFINIKKYQRKLRNTPYQCLGNGRSGRERRVV